MDEKIVRERIMELAEVVAHAPLQPAQGPGAYIPHLDLPAKTTDDLCDFVRLHVRYMLFDLEATRRENKYLRQMLERRPNSLNEGDEAP